MVHRFEMRIENLASAVTARVKRFLENIEGHARVRMVLFFMLLVLIGGIMFLLNTHTPLMMDDYDYSFSWATGEPIGGIADIVASQAAHYQLWGGRSIVHTLAQFFLSLNKRVFNIANTLMYLLLLLEIYMLVRPKNRSWNWEILLVAHTALFAGVPFFGTVFLWLTGACNYLWGTALALVPLLIAKSAMEEGFFTRNWYGWLALPLSFLSGWTNENTACGVLGMMIILLALRTINRESVYKWQWASLAAQAVGTAIMLLAPGNFSRASSYDSGSIVVELLKRAITATAYGGVYIGVLLSGVIMLWALCGGLCVKRRSYNVLFMLLGTLGAAYSMVASPVFSDRSWTGVYVLALCAMLILAGDIISQVRVFDAAKILILPLAVLLVAYSGYKALGQVKAHEQAWLAQLAVIEEAVNEGKEQVSICGVESVSSYTMDIGLSTESTAWPNSTLSKVFGINVTGM